MRAANRKRAQPSSATRVVRRVQPERRSASASGSLLEATANAKQQSAPANSPRCYRAGCSQRQRDAERGQCAAAVALRHERHFRCQAKAAAHRVTGAAVALLSSRMKGAVRASVFERGDQVRPTRLSAPRCIGTSRSRVTSRGVPTRPGVGEMRDGRRPRGRTCIRVWPCTGASAGVVTPFVRNRQGDRWRRGCCFGDCKIRASG